jgi:hypothetical protein
MATPLDPVGAGLSVAGLVALVYGIIEAPNHGWTDPLTLGSFGLTGVLAIAFVRWELRVEHPMLRMEFFRNPRFSVASMAISLTFFVLFGMAFLLTQHLQFALGYTPLEAGLRIMPVAVLIVVAPLSARLVEAAGTKVVVAAGLVGLGVGLGLLSTIEVSTGYSVVAWSLLVFGTGMGLVMPPATESIMGSLPLAKAGVGSAMNDTTRMVGGALGVAVLGSVLASSYASAIEPALRGMPREAAEAAGDSIAGAAAVAAQLRPSGQDLFEAARSAFIEGMGDAMLVGIGAAMLAAVLVLVLLPARGREEASLSATMAVRSDPVGELPSPGPIGLAIRVILGAIAIYAFIDLAGEWNVFLRTDPIESERYFTVFTLCLLADVFNIGLRRRWGAWPVVVLLAVAAVMGTTGYLASGEIWTTPLTTWVYAADVLVFAALAVSFPVAIVTRTPGCEFNAIPRLVAWLRGTADEETRRCLLRIDALDGERMRRSDPGVRGGPTREQEVAGNEGAATYQAGR